MSNLNGNWTLDPAHSEIRFTVRHAMVTKVRGYFPEFVSNIHVDLDNLEASTATATIKVDSVNTKNKDRDAHLRGADFFDTEKFPEMSFSSTSFDLESENGGTVTGDLTIKGITKPVTLDVEIAGIAEDPFGNTRLGFEATTTINRSEFGVDWQAPLKTGGVLLSEKIKIEIEGSAIKEQ